MTVPGLGGIVPPGGDWVARKIKDLENAVAELRTARSADHTIVEGLFKVAGQIDVSGTATFEGDTTIGGDLAVVGTLSLPAGIIDNDALASPADFDVLNGVVANLTISTSLTTRITRSVAVPSGYTRALVHALGHIYVLSSTANPQCISKIDINGTLSDGALVRGNTGNIVEAIDSLALEVTGLGAGDHITVIVNGSATSCDSGGGTAQLSASIVWLR